MDCKYGLYSKDFGRCIDWLRLAAQSLFRISGHPEVFTAIIKKNPRFIVILFISSYSTWFKRADCLTNI